LLLERAFYLRQQCWFWSLLYLVFALSIGICGFIARKQWMVGCSAQGIAGAACPPACHSPVETTHLQKDASNETSGIDPVLWLVCGTIRLMATTNQMTQDIVPVPFLWILPLGLYLLTFIICFDRPGWYSRTIYRAAGLRPHCRDHTIDPTSKQKTDHGDQPGSSCRICLRDGIGVVCLELFEKSQWFITGNRSEFLRCD
jgi:hypothetical protein